MAERGRGQKRSRQTSDPSTSACVADGRGNGVQASRSRRRRHGSDREIARHGRPRSIYCWLGGWTEVTACIFFSPAHLAPLPRPNLRGVVLGHRQPHGPSRPLGLSNVPPGWRDNVLSAKAGKLPRMKRKVERLPPCLAARLLGAQRDNGARTFKVRRRCQMARGPPPWISGKLPRAPGPLQDNGLTPPLHAHHRVPAIIRSTSAAGRAPFGRPWGPFAAAASLGVEAGSFL